MAAPPLRSARSRARVLALTALAMVAFAANSLLCRMALRHTRIDAASFTTVRIASGALALAAVVRARGAAQGGGSWLSALALFAYAAGFSFAYLTLPASAGALLLFAAVQATMIGHGLLSGERLRPRAVAGMLIAFGGLVGLLLPGLSAPPLAGALLMIAAGGAWGVYSLRGRGRPDAVRTTAGNFLRAAPFALALSAMLLRRSTLDPAGLGYAAASGALASGLGYVLWYAALRDLRATSAATVQLCVPVLAAAGGVALLGERLSVRLVLASAAILGGIALVLLGERRRA